jgi:iron complex transport system substrate-binding protein
MGGRAVVIVADAVYAFPTARARITAVGGTDQGLGTFLKIVDPGFRETPSLQRQSGAEVYAALRPDLVILKAPMKAQVGPGLDALGIRTLYLNLESPEDYYIELTVLGSVLGEPARAAELVDYYRDIVARASRAASGFSGAAGAGSTSAGSSTSSGSTSAGSSTSSGSTSASSSTSAGVDRAGAGSSTPANTSAATAGPRLLMLQASGDGYEVPPDSWMQTRLATLAGAQPVWKGANPGGGWAKVGPEQILAWNPDIICIISYSDDAAVVASRFKADARFASTRAVRNGQVLGMPQDFLSWDQPDARWGLGLMWLSDRLYPGRLAGYSPEAEARRFFSLFYGLDAAAFDQHIRPRLRGDWQ